MRFEILFFIFLATSPALASLEFDELESRVQKLEAKSTEQATERRLSIDDLGKLEKRVAEIETRLLALEHGSIPKSASAQSPTPDADLSEKRKTALDARFVEKASQAICENHLAKIAPKHCKKELKNFAEATVILAGKDTVEGVKGTVSTATMEEKVEFSKNSALLECHDVFFGADQKRCVELLSEFAKTILETFPKK